MKRNLRKRQIFTIKKSGGFSDKMYLAGRGEEEKDIRNALRRRTLEEGQVWWGNKRV